MSWFKKKEGEKFEQSLELPELPELPGQFDNLILPSKKDLDYPGGIPDLEIDELPPLPNSYSEDASQREIKQAIFHPPKDMFKSKFRPIEHIESIKTIAERSKTPETLETGTLNARDYHRPSQKKSEPIYIRLDKFETTNQIFEEIKNKIIEVEEFLMKTKEIKAREEQELEEWEREIQIIKARLDTIDKNLFYRLD